MNQMINQDAQASDQGAHVKSSTPVQEAVEVTNNQQTQAETVGGEEFWITKRSKTSKAWDDYKEFDENGIYNAIRKYHEAKVNKQQACGGIGPHVWLEKQR